MKLLAKCAATAVFLLTATAAPVCALTSADIEGKVEAAMKAAKSFVVSTQYPPQAYVSTLVYVAPDRFRASIAVAANTTDMITIGSTTYTSHNGTPFEKATASADDHARIKSLTTVKVLAPHADVAIDGVVYGAFEGPAPTGNGVALICEYDKETYRLVRCSDNNWTQTFKSYDDPQNVVDAPPETK